MKPTLFLSAFAAFSAAFSTSLTAQDPRLVTVPVTDNIYMLQGNGGNIGLCVGKDGAFLIDDQFAPIVPQIQAAVAKLSKTPVKFLVNTHWHGDHTGGNERLGKAGALIYAHDNVRKRMTADQLKKSVAGKKDAALPVVTFSKTMTFHWNGEKIHAFHVENAHTDGDAVIHFTKANVVHMGDVMFHGRFPFIDVRSGGSVKGLIAAVDKVLARIDDKTKVIPGHGDLTDKAGLSAYRSMLQTVTSRVEKLITDGRSREEAVAAKPSKEYDAKWTWAFIKPERFVGAIYDSLKLDAGKKVIEKRRK